MISIVSLTNEILFLVSINIGQRNKLEKIIKHCGSLFREQKIKIQAACSFEVGYFIMIAFLWGAYAHEYHLSVVQ